MNNSSKKSYESMVKEIREKLAILLLDSFDRLPEDFKKLDPKDRITSLTQLSRYVLPSLQSVDVTPKVDQSEEFEEKIKEINKYMQTLNDKPKYSEHPAYNRLGKLKI
jgi:uncharacterized protein YfkK (UPF0435 family)